METRQGNLTEFEVTLTARDSYDTEYVIHRDATEWNEDGDPTHPVWHWSVTHMGMGLDCDSKWSPRWVNAYGLGHDGFPSAEEALDHMRLHAHSPEEYMTVYREGVESARRAEEDPMSLLMNLGMDDR